MKVRIDFTLDIPSDNLEALKEFAGEAETPEQVRLFIVDEAEQYLLDYLRDNGFDPKVVRRNGLKVTDSFAGYQARD